MSPKGTVYLISGAPLVGKSSAIEALIGLTRARTPPVLCQDNELGFSLAMRAKVAAVSGVALNSPEFVRSFNLQGQLDYQAACRSYAAQGFDVVMPGPFEDLTPDIPVGDTKVPLLRKMQQDFGGHIRFFQLVLLPEDVEVGPDNVVGHPAMVPIEAEIQRRREFRGRDNPYQQQLDADKGGPNYYAERLRKQLLTYNRFPQAVSQVRVHLKDSPLDVATKLARAMFS